MPAQSESSAHCTHFVSLQTGVPAFPAQSALALHSTQAPEDTRHFGVGCEHCASLVQAAARHTPFSTSHLGVVGVPEQSVLVTHWTHFPSVRLQ